MVAVEVVLGLRDLDCAHRRVEAHAVFASGFAVVRLLAPLHRLARGRAAELVLLPEPFLARLAVLALLSVAARHRTILLPLWSCLLAPWSKRAASPTIPCRMHRLLAVPDPLPPGHVLLGARRSSQAGVPALLKLLLWHSTARHDISPEISIC